MTAYSKLIAAVLSVLLMRWLLRATGIDVAALGVESEFRLLLELGIDLAAAGVSGFFVWLVPNVRARWNALWGKRS